MAAQPEAGDPDQLERSEELIGEAREVVHDALPETTGDVEPETSDGGRYPRPGDEDGGSEMF